MRAKAEQPVDAVQKRIAAVEQSLVPTVRVKGRQPARMSEEMRRLNVPGVSVAVIDDYRIAWAKGYGMADSESGTAVTTDSRFLAGSVSKPVTAMAALRLVQQGALDLDRNVNEQLKSWKVPDNKFTTQHPVDLRGLLSHTAGLTVHGFPGYAVDAPIPSVPQVLNGEKPANTAPVRVNKVPGRGFRYSGGGTTIVQQLLIDVTNQPFPELMRQNVLEPLEMTASTYEQPLPQGLAAIAASGHKSDGKVVPGRWHVYPEMAAAGLWTTPSDVARYAIEVQLAHQGKSHKVIDRKLVEEMLTPQGGGPVGLGPFLEGGEGSRRFYHGGDDEGFVCQFVAYLDRGQGAVVMTNAQMGGKICRELINAIALVYEWPNYLPPEREAHAIDQRKLERLVGNYDLGLVGGVKIERRGEQLVALSPVGEFEFFMQSDIEFFTEEPNITGRFILDEDGTASELVVKLGEETMTGKRARAN